MFEMNIKWIYLMNACHTHQQHTSAPVFLYFVIIDWFWSIQKFQNVIDNLFSIFRDQRDPSFVRPMKLRFPWSMLSHTLPEKYPVVNKETFKKVVRLHHMIKRGFPKIWKFCNHHSCKRILPARSSNELN